jgi:hypothetical protein
VDEVVVRRKERVQVMRIWARLRKTCAQPQLGVTWPNVQSRHDVQLRSQTRFEHGTSRVVPKHMRLHVWQLILYFVLIPPTRISSRRRGKKVCFILLLSMPILTTFMLDTPTRHALWALGTYLCPPGMCPTSNTAQRPPCAPHTQCPTRSNDHHALWAQGTHPPTSYA